MKNTLLKAVNLTAIEANGENIFGYNEQITVRKAKNTKIGGSVSSADLTSYEHFSEITRVSRRMVRKVSFSKVGNDFIADTQQDFAITKKGFVPLSEVVL